MGRRSILKLSVSLAVAVLTIIVRIPMRSAIAQSDQGCCSRHGGDAQCVGTRLMCNDGQISPTCSCRLPPSSQVKWELSSNDGLLPRSGLYQPTGGSIPSPITWTCSQGAPHRDTTSTGSAYESVSVTCKGSLGDEVSLMGACLSAQADSNIAIMQIKSSLGTSSYTLSCTRP